MKMIKCFVLSFILLIAINSYGQVTEFKLSDYKYRTPVFSSLQLDLDLAQSSSTYNQGGGNFKNSGIAASLYGFLRYTTLFATDAKQHESGFASFTQPQVNSNKQQGLKNVNNNFNFGAYYYTSDRIYKENYFIEMGGSANAQITTKKSGTDVQNSKENLTYLNLDGNVGIGKGRLEYVHDAQTALLILENLYASGIIKARVDQETANKFAQLITNIKKQRILDARRRTVYQLTRIDSFLKSSKLITECDIRTMAIINDNLFYAFTNDLSGNVNAYGPQPDFDFTRFRNDEGEGADFGLYPELEPISDQSFRRHGTIMYARLIPDLTYQATNTKTHSPTKDSVHKSDRLLFQPELQLGIEKHQAINLQWQKTYSAMLSFAYRTGPDAAMYVVGNGQTVYLTGMYGIGYYPNSRTIVEGNGAMRFGYFGEKGSKTFLIDPSVSFSAAYFISYNTVLRARFNAGYSNFFGDSKSSGLQESFRIYLRHYFF